MNQRDCRCSYRSEEDSGYESIVILSLCSVFAGSFEWRDQVPVGRTYGHRPSGLTWAMARVGTVMMPSAARTLMASAGPLTSGPHQA